MNATIARRAFMILPLVAALPGRVRAAMPSIADALGRSVVLKAPAERVVFGFNFEEFTAVAGVDGWERVVGVDRHQWENNPRASWVRYQVAIPPLPTLADKQFLPMKFEGCWMARVMPVCA
jgi:iron complex transport system substrate-binding protein